MKKFASLLIVLAMTLALLVGCSGNADATASTANPSESNGAASNDAANDGSDAESMIMRMHLSCGTTDYVYLAGERFAELVHEKTGGNVTVELYPNSSLGTTADCIEGLSLGACNIVFDSVGNLASLTELANIDAAPYLYSSENHYRTVWEGEVGETIRTAVGQDCDKVLLGYGLQGVRVLTTTAPVNSVDDIKGMKIRVPTISIYLDTWDWLGANPTPMAAADVFTAIQQGTVEGQENPYGASVGLSMYEVCNYVTESNHVYSGNSFVFDTTYFNNLPAEYQTALREAANDSTSYLTDLAIEAAAEKKAVFVDAGCEIITTDIQAWQAVFDGFLEEKYPVLVEYASMIQAVDPA